MHKEYIKTTRGSDIRLAITWRTEDGEPLNLTGADIDIIDASPGISEVIEATITDATAGQIEIFIEGSEPIELGRYNFRIQVNYYAGDSIATPIIGVQVA
jgi:hypothetical protein